MELPCPEIKPIPSTLEVQSLNHWTTREVPPVIFQVPSGSYIGWYSSRQKKKVGN